jgi:hypothetical protein
MSSKATTTVVDPAGLRYRSKPAGTPFATTGNSRSCFKCGKHRRVEDLRTMKVLGRHEMVCKPTCAT